MVWFGEPLPAEGLRAAATAARRAVVVIVAGTSSLVYPAASLPVAAREAGAYVVEVNPEPTPMSSLAHERLRGPAGEILPRIVEAAGIEPARTA